jgi:hypothetical protein
MDGGEWSASRFGRFIARIEPLYPLNNWLDRPRTRYGRFGKEKNFLFLPGFEPRTVQPLA